MTLRTGNGKNERGFTLVEVLVAVVILSTGIVLILRSFDASLAALDAARSAIRADALLRTKAAEVELHGLPTRYAEGGFDAPDGDFVWDISTETLDRRGELALYRATITVRRKATGSRYSLDTYLAGKRR